MNNRYNIFYHVYIFLNWYPIVEEQLNNLKNSGLLDKSKLYENDTRAESFIEFSNLS